MVTMIMLDKKLVKALENHEDTAPILKEIREFREREDEEKKLAEAQKVADERQQLHERAETIKATVAKQSNAIDEFLKARDGLLSQLQPLLEPMRQLAKMAAGPESREGSGDCYLINDLQSFAATIKGIPRGYFEADWGCPFLEMKGGEQDARGKASEALRYLTWACGILSNLQKGISKLSLTKPGNSLLEAEGDDAIEVPPPSSKKSKAKRGEPKSPASSANQTFFQG
jgi:hypothetical protein